MKWLLRGLLIVQGLLAIRVFARMARTSRGVRIEAAPPVYSADDHVTILIPVLNEIERLGLCLDGAIQQPEEVREMLVIDGGSRDGTQALVSDYAQCDRRIRLLEAGPPAPGQNGKAHQLEHGFRAMSPESRWVLTLDADVRPDPRLTRSLIKQAQKDGLEMLSVATAQRLPDAATGILHPALLTTLVYRYGIPGNATDRVEEVQANGQCTLIRSDLLAGVGGFAEVSDSLNEDVTLAREVARSGRRVGFFETDGLIATEMYRNWRETWRNWPRSLALRDRLSGPAGWIGYAEMVAVQALPSFMVAAGLRRSGAARSLMPLNVSLLIARFGVLAGMRRAYIDPPATYWISPLCDAPAAAAVIASACRRRHAWRGRTITRGGIS